MPSTFDLYDHPGWYDILFRKGSAAAARGLVRVARAFRPAGAARPVFLEPACGTGRLLAPLARLGYRTLGYDRNPAMVAYARRRLAPLRPRPRVEEADFEAASRRFGARVADVAFTLDNSVRLLPDAGALGRHLADTARLLRPGGVYIVGVTFHDPGRAGPSEDSWEGRRGRCRVRQLVQFLPPEPGSRGRHEEVLEHVAVERPRGTEHRDARWRLLLVTRRGWEAVVRTSPFRWVATVDSSGEAISPGTFDSQWLVLALPGPSGRRRASS